MCLLGYIVRLRLSSNASIPCGLGFISPQRSLLTPVPCLSDLIANPGVLRIASFPSRLFFGKGLVLPRMSAADSFIAMTEPAPANSGASAAARSRLLQDRHD
jgi:hypothetical protein